MAKNQSLKPEDIAKAATKCTANLAKAQDFMADRKYKKAILVLEEAVEMAKEANLAEITFYCLKALAQAQRNAGLEKQAEKSESKAVELDLGLEPAKAIGLQTEQEKRSKTEKKSDTQLDKKPEKQPEKQPNKQKGKASLTALKAMTLDELVDGAAEPAAKAVPVRPIKKDEKEEKTWQYYLGKSTTTRKYEKKVEYCQKAVKAARKEIGKDWESKYQGIFWKAHETRPIMICLAELARNLRWEDELEEAIEIYEKLMTLNPDDNQGIRYHLAPALLEAGRYLELEELLRKYGSESHAFLLYTRALWLFTRDGVTRQADEALLRAFKRNPHVPIFLSDIIEMPEEIPETMGIGDENEAIAYVLDNGYLWEAPATKWMADVLEKELFKAFAEDSELISEVLFELKLL
jgi:tetratricopeptide (TPR) repeat protein